VHRAIEGVDASGDAGQSVGGGGGSAVAVVGDGDDEAVAAVVDVDPGVGGVGVFGGVGEEVGDGEVGGGLDGVGGAAVEVDGDGDGELVGQGEGVDGAVESAFDEDGWVDAADEVAEFGEGLAGGFAGFGEHGAGGVGVVGDDLFGHAQVHAEGDEAGLGAVVEVAFDAADFGGLGVDGVGA